MAVPEPHLMGFADRVTYKKHPEMSERTYLKFQHKSRTGYKTYNEKTMLEAVNAVLNGLYSKTEAARVYNIPKTTLWDRLKTIERQQMAEKLQQGPDGVLIQNMEETHEFNVEENSLYANEMDGEAKHLARTNVGISITENTVGITDVKMNMEMNKLGLSIGVNEEQETSDNVPIELDTAEEETLETPSGPDNFLE